MDRRRGHNIVFAYSREDFYDQLKESTKSFLNGKISELRWKRLCICAWHKYEGACPEDCQLTVELSPTSGALIIGPVSI